MRSRTPPDLTGRCPRCLMREVLCVCADIPRVETRTRFVILRHVLETLKSTNTARLAHLALPNSEIVPHGAQDRPLDPAAVAPPGTWLLYPGGNGALPAEPPDRVLVLDGSWSQARRMLQRLHFLHDLPRLSLVPRQVDRARMRKQHLDEGMSTLEAVAAAVALLEGEEKSRRLDELYSDVTARVLRSRGTFPGEGMFKAR
ncbi:MAG: DTW domain-containing protein [Deltaproteobacteria bacterium]|nr:DTW domain-containing protein [Deltaproteobacteria bacterium]